MHSLSGSQAGSYVDKSEFQQSFANFEMRMQLMMQNMMQSMAQGKVSAIPCTATRPTEEGNPSRLAASAGGRTTVTSQPDVPLDTEWCLKKSVVKVIFLKMGEPMIDLFATGENRQVPIFCSRHQDQLAFHVDALTLNWDGLVAYAFPPFSLIHLILDRVNTNSDSPSLASPVVVAEATGSFSRHSNTTSCCTRSLAAVEGHGVAPETGSLPSYGMETERQRLRQAGLSEEVINTISKVTLDHPQRRCMVGSGQCLEIGVLNERGSNPCSAYVTEVCALLQSLLDKGLAYRTLGVFRSSISKFHNGLDGKNL